MVKIVLIGAGSSQFGLGTVSDIFKSNVLKDCNVTLHDINHKALEKTRSTAEKYKKDFKANCTIKATTNRKEALKNADYCLISIEVGNRFELWDQDWKIPLQYGFKQIYGENGGPGGLFHSLRITPAILEICEDINNICPEAFVFNYSNPMQRICHAVTTKYPKMKFIGLCHEIASMERQLPALMETEFENIEIKAGGLNHFSILLEAKYKDTNENGYPKIRDNFDNYYSTLVNENDDYHRSKPGGERGVFFELYKTYGYLPITTDSHLGEYLQWGYSVADHDAISHFYNNYKNHCLSFHSDKVSKEHFFDPSDNTNRERIIPIIESIIQDKNMIEDAVNIPNDNYIDSLPKDIVVEVPAVINKEGIHGQRLDNYPSNFGSLLNNQASTIQLTTEAILNKSKHSVYLALLADPIVDNTNSAEKLVNTMIEFQKDYLSYLN